MLASGYDAVAVLDIMPQAADIDILARAVQENRVLLTNDKDFGDFVYRNGLAHRGVVLFRLRDESAANRIRVLQLLLDHYATELADHFVVVTDSSVRVRAGRRSETGDA